MMKEIDKILISNCIGLQKYLSLKVSLYIMFLNLASLRMCGNLKYIYGIYIKCKHWFFIEFMYIFLFKLENIARYEKINKSDDRGESMFKEDKTSGMLFLRLVLECIENWSIKYPT